MPVTGECTDSPVYRERAEIEAALQELAVIRESMVAGLGTPDPRLGGVHANYQDSARNLLHYLALRRQDLRHLQFRLAALGLSSLGRAESHVLAAVDRVLEVLHRLTGRSLNPPFQNAAILDFAKGQLLLAEHTDTLLGPSTPGREVRIMVTMPSEAGTDYTLVHNLLKHGMDCMRINCAHDDSTTWMRMIRNLRRAEQSLGRSCRIFMDLEGPKLRTGPLEPGPAIVRIRPRRDIYGRVTAPARVWLTSQTAPYPPPSPADACLPVSPTWLGCLRSGERVKFNDARDTKRTFTIVDVTERGCWAEATKTAYVVPGTILR